MIGSLSGWAHGFAATVPLFADDPVTEEEVFHLSATAATIGEFDSYTAHVGQRATPRRYPFEMFWDCQNGTPVP